MTPSLARADDFLLADGKAWPGKLLLARGDSISTVLERVSAPHHDAVPRLRSVATLRDGRVVFCSGLDRTIFELTMQGEQVLHHGGYQARQVRTDDTGNLYWSAVETPQNDNPLPDGFIFKWDAKSKSARPLMTFSQGDVGRDWWGAFDVRAGRIYVGTQTSPTSIYDVTDVAPVHLLCTLPFAATAFRFGDDGSLWACNGRGKLYRFEDPRHPGEGELRLSTKPFVDFLPVTQP